MKIGLDYISAVGGSGNARYSRNLIKSLSEIDRENEYYLYGFFHDYFLGRKSGIAKPNFKFRPGYFSSLGLPVSGGFMRKINNFFMPLSARLKRLRLFHFTSPINFIPNIPNSIVTIHDLIPLYNSAWAREGPGNWFNSNIASILSGASKIIASSNFTKNDILKKFNINENKVKVVYLAAEDIFYPDRDFEYVAKKFGLDKYILYAGQLQPRKNIIGLVSAYGKIDSTLRNEYKLVLAGGVRERAFSDCLNDHIQKLKIENNVVCLGRVKDDDLRKLYSCAGVFAFPSLSEGFGLPVLEALRCGTPVVTSNISSLPEVAGEAGILVDPDNAEDIKGALEKILTDKEIYSAFKRKCAGQANKFSWEKTARETLSVYKAI